MIKRIVIGISLTLTGLTVIAAAWFATGGYLFLARPPSSSRRSGRDLALSLLPCFAPDNIH